MFWLPLYSGECLLRMRLFLKGKKRTKFSPHSIPSVRREADTSRREWSPWTHLKTGQFFYRHYRRKNTHFAFVPILLYFVCRNTLLWNKREINLLNRHFLNLGRILDNKSTYNFYLLSLSNISVSDTTLKSGVYIIRVWRELKFFYIIH